MEVLSSSLRETSPENTLRRVRLDAARVGVTRVTDITQLDVIGIPTFSSVRGDADSRSLHVHNGKGVRAIEAQVGAYAEAIEFALADPTHTQLQTYKRTVRDLVNQELMEWNFIDYCPLLDAEVSQDTELYTTKAKIYGKENTVEVPLELVVHPAAPYNDNASIFGTSTNGLASGNTVEEAVLHGALEVIERDIRAFTKAGLESFRISANSLPVQGPVAEVVTKIYNSGFELIICYTPNKSGIYYFEAYLVDPDENNPASLCYGSAAHVCRDIALVRSITEAAQSRLTYIHGGRDDITKRFQHYAIAGKTVESQDVKRRKRELQNLSCINLPKSANRLTSINDAIDKVSNVLEDFGLGPLLWVDLSNPRITLKVVRVIVPRAEFYKEDFQRVGPRLAAMLGVS